MMPACAACREADEWTPRGGTGQQAARSITFDYYLEEY